MARCPQAWIVLDRTSKKSVRVASRTKHYPKCTRSTSFASQCPRGALRADPHGGISRAKHSPLSPRQAHGRRVHQPPRATLVTRVTYLPHATDLLLRNAYSTVYSGTKAAKTVSSRSTLPLCTPTRTVTVQSALSARSGRHMYLYFVFHRLVPFEGCESMEPFEG